MRIAFIGQRGIPAYYGGVERRVEELSTRMAKRGHRVFVYARKYYSSRNGEVKPIKSYKGVKIINIWTLKTRHLDTIIYSLIASVHALFCDYDIVHYQAPGPSSLAWIVKLFKPSATVVATFNSRDQFHRKWGFLASAYLRFCERLICTIPHRTVTVSNILRREAKKEYGCDITVIPNGATVPRSRKSDRIQKMGLLRDQYILTVNRLVSHKGVHYLVKAFMEMEDAGQLPKGMKLVVVGSSSLIYQTEYEKQLKKMAEGRENIVFAGSRFGADLSQLLTHARVFVQPSEAEGLSTVVLEAMGCGKCVLVSDIKENLDAINSRDNAATFKNTSVLSLKRKLGELLAKPAMAHKLALNARQFARENYDWEKVTTRYLGIYKEAIEERAQDASANSLLSIDRAS